MINTRKNLNMKEKRGLLVFLFVILILISVNVNNVLAYQYEVGLSVKLQGISQGTWKFGMDSLATDSFDSGIDSAQPPPPPGSDFDVYFYEASEVLFKNLRIDIKSVENIKQWVLFVKAPASQRVNVSWPVLSGYSKLNLVQLDPVSGNPTGVVINMLTTNLLSVQGGAFGAKTDVYRIELELTPECTTNADCSDNLYCNGVETCVSGTCQAGTPLTCNDGISCTSGTCNEVTDSCDYVYNDAVCDDGLFCDGAETCIGLGGDVNGCQAGIPPTIDDGVSCTVDNCNEASNTVTNTPDNSLCLDGLWCTGQEYCDALLDCQLGTPVTCNDGIFCTLDSCGEGTPGDNIGSCLADTSACECSVATQAVDCNDNNPCTDDVCGSDLTCSNVNDNTNTCNDNAFCTMNDRCSAGTCISDLRPFDDGVSCTDDSCDEINDVILNIPNNAVCDDGLFCDGAEVCNAVNGCQAGIPPTIDDGISCTVDNCNEASNTVTNTPDNSLCLDGLWCTGQEYCDALLDCQLGTPVTCNDGIFCTLDSCGEGTPGDNIGSCLADTSACECSVATQAVDCNDNNPCTDDVCGSDLTCSNVPANDGLSCSDGSICTKNDFCSSGTCSGTPVTIDDGVSCTDDSCTESQGVQHIPRDSVCDDGLFCDGAETCIGLGGDANGCQAGIPPSLNDNVGCTLDNCDEDADTVTHVPTDNLCNNGLFCDGVEVCDVNLDCQSGVSPDCSGLGDQCNSGLCNENTDSCIKNPAPKEGNVCNDNLFCNINELCSGGVCGGGISRNCFDSVSCTQDSCNEVADSCDNVPDNGLCVDTFSCTDDSCNILTGCQNIENDANCVAGETCDINSFSPPTGCGIFQQCTGQPDGTDCDDGLFCNVGETCQAESCVSGNARDCTSFNLPALNRCDYSPDDNPFTRDTAPAITSSCYENNDKCTQGTYDVTSVCDLTCGAQCINDNDVSCPVDVCIENAYANYPDNGLCSGCLIDDGTGSGEGCELNLETDSLQCRALVDFTLTIKPGINFVSIPLILENKSIENIFAGHIDKIFRIYSYQEAWKAYYFEKPILSSLTSIDEGKGYIIFAKEGFSISLQGYTKLGNTAPYTKLGFNLVQGWNLIGSFKDVSVSEYLAGKDYGAVFEFDEDDRVYNQLSNTDVLSKDKGYWVFMNSAGQVGG